MPFSKPAMMGHNNPPQDLDEIAFRMKELYADVLARAENLVEAEERVPDVINDDDTSGKIGDYIKQITASIKALDAARTGEKEPYLAAGRAVDGFFKRYTDKLKDLKDRVSKPHAEYIKKRDDEKRRLREEEAERKRLEAEEKLREAERQRKEAEDLRRKQEEEAREAQRKADEDRRRLEAEKEAQRKAHEEEMARLKKEQEEKDRRAREEQERLKKEADEKILHERAEAQRALEDAERKRKEEAAEHKKKMKEAEDRQREAEKKNKEAEREITKTEKESRRVIADIVRSAKTHERESDRQLEEAVRLDQQAERIDKSLEDTKLARIRGEQGSLSSMREDWRGNMTDRKAIDLEALRYHLHEDALNAAVQSFVDAGGRELRGASIWKDLKAVVR